jgi:hypothetical protein
MTNGVMMRGLLPAGSINRAIAFPIVLILTLAGCEGGISEPPGDEPPGDEPHVELPTTTNTVTIPISGGTVALADGTAVVFPSGAVSAPLSVTLRKESATDFVDGTSESGMAVVSATAAVTEFLKEVEIRVPLPAGMTPQDSSDLVAGLIHEETGGVLVERSEIVMEDGKPFAVIRTNHFSRRLVEWLVGKKPPTSAGPLPVPFYGQGESSFCWAASLQMVTQAARFEQDRMVTDIIGRAGVDEGGITGLSFRFGSAITDIVRDRTGVRPTRKQWDFGNYGQLRWDLMREIGVNGRPVAIHHSAWEHAVVVVGYNNLNTFLIHDPASTNTDGVGFETKTWAQIAEKMGVGQNITSLVIPAGLNAGGDGPRINVLPRAMRVMKPGSGAASPSEGWDLDWHHGARDGYGFVAIGTKDIRSVLPGEVTTLQLDNIEISNSSRQSALDATVWVDIQALGAPVGVGRFADHSEMTLPSNSVRAFKRNPILVDEFRLNRATATEYVLMVTAMLGTTTVDRHRLYFKIDPVTPALTSLDPETSQVGQSVRITGTGFGQLAKNNTVTFNGTPATEVQTWSDTAIVVRVPAAATSGPVVVSRGEVPSNGLPFTVVDFLSSQTFNLAWGVKAERAEARAEITVEALSSGGGWYRLREERSAFNPMTWLKLWFRTVPPSGGGGNQYRITADVKELLIAEHLGRQADEIEYRWIVRDQETGTPREVKGPVVEVSEVQHWGALQLDLVLDFKAIRDGSSNPIGHELAGLYLSFHPTNN